MRARRTSEIGTRETASGASVAGRAAVTRVVAPRVLAQQQQVAPERRRRARGAEVFVHLGAVAHRDHQRVEILVGQSPAQRRLGEGAAGPLVRTQIVQPPPAQCLHRHHADALLLRLCDHPRKLGLERDHVEAFGQPCVEGGVLAEVEGHQDHVDEVLVERHVEALDQPARVPRHPSETELSLALRALHELEPLGIREPLALVHRMVQIDVDVVGLEPAERAMQALHQDLACIG
jgi:hypothetical protein